MDLIGNEKVVEMFLGACERLRAMGATRVEGLGFVATFGPAVQPERKPAEEQPQRTMSAEARELHDRAQRLLGGVR